ncbi:TRAP transporter substrate-binding protein DctP [Acuticoccus sp. M5D2P5]|uniref:TRAP transporter substrate-binding protein DctP n=1 Tax=Acuticoccus kalidii TaxID=2910977 RepID=UPI001F451013|nr:TRAP transporter substrate-binding protein DctP [Acuticoccus kalidii]MCF3933847.1 TRAP transporter substrate-binding protein DctP [Acuticoccus kalidii]
MNPMTRIARRLETVLSGRRSPSVRMVAMAAAVSLASAAPAAAQSFTFATNTAPNNLRGAAETMFIEELSKATNGEIEIIPYWGAALMSGNEILGGVRDGVADLGFVNINYYPNELLINSSFNLFPKGPTKYEDIYAAFKSVYDSIPELEEEMARQGQRIVYIYGVTPYAGTFTEPVTSLSDFEGRRVRASSRWYLNLLGGAGATPVSVPWGDLYQALQTGSIDGVFTNIDGINRASLDEAAPNVLIFDGLWLATPFLITMNEDKYQSLTDEQKAAFETAATESSKKYAEAFDAEIARIIEAEKAAGYTVNHASEEDMNTFANLPQVEENRQVWAKEAAAAGVENPESILERVGAVVDEYASK